MDLTAFDAAEIDHVLELDLPQANVIEDEEQIPARQSATGQQAWRHLELRRHRLGCGNAHDGDLSRACAMAAPYVCFTDPPYNVPIAGFVSGKGRSQHREFVQGTGEMSPDEFTASWPRL